MASLNFLDNVSYFTKNRPLFKKYTVLTFLLILVLFVVTQGVLASGSTDRYDSHTYKTQHFDEEKTSRDYAHNDFYKKGSYDDKDGICYPSDCDAQHKHTKPPYDGHDDCPGNEPPPTKTPSCTLALSQESMVLGEEATLSWNTVNTVDASLDPNLLSPQLPSSSLVVSPVTTTSYTMTVLNEKQESATCSATLAVTTPADTSPSCTLTAEPAVLTLGATTTLSWDTERAVSGVLDPDSLDTTLPQGTHIVEPTEDTIYSLTVTNEFQETFTCTAAITVEEPGPGPGPGPSPSDPTCTLTLDPQEVFEGEEALLLWETTNATTIILHPGDLAVTIPNGSQTVSPTTTTEYLLEVLGSNNATVSCSAQLLVQKEDTPETPHVVTGGGGGGGSSLCIGNTKPVANAGDFLVTHLGETVVFDGSASRDPDGGQPQLTWNIQESGVDGFPLFGTTPSFTGFTLPGTYHITLEARDLCSFDTATIEVVVEEPGAIVLVKVVSDTDEHTVTENTAEPGEIITYTLRVAHESTTTLTGVVLADDFDERFIDIVDAGDAKIENGVLVWDIGTLAPGETLEKEFTARVLGTSTDLITNTAFLHSNERNSLTAYTITHVPQEAVGGPESSTESTPIAPRTGFGAGVLTLSGFAASLWYARSPRKRKYKSDQTIPTSFLDEYLQK